MLKVKPSNPEIKVRDPKTMQFIPAEGLEVDELSTYWHRAIASGDVVFADDAHKVEKVKKSKKDFNQNSEGV